MAWKVLPAQLFWLGFEKKTQNNKPNQQYKNNNNKKSPPKHPSVIPSVNSSVPALKIVLLLKLFWKHVPSGGTVYLQQTGVVIQLKLPSKA